MKTSNINVKDLLKKLSFLKNNLALLVPILIAVVAILLFIPTTLLSGKLRKTIEQQSVRTGQQIGRLVRDVNQSVDPETLDAYLKLYEQDAKDMNDLMKQTTMRELLTYKLFPDTNETSPLLFEEFRGGFLSGVDAMLGRMKAGSPPTDSEITAALDSSPVRSMYGRSRSGSASLYGGGNALPGQRRSFRMMSEMDRKIVDKVCEDRARSALVYASQIDLGGYTYWSDWKYEGWDKAVRECWYWQMAYWILEDVTATMVELNQGSDSVLSAPVKRIMSVQFTMSRTGRSIIGRGRRTSAVPRDKQIPGYVRNVKTAMTGTPCTGRFCNEQLDVMHFDVRLVVRAADVMRVIQELCSAKTHKFRGYFGDQPEQTFKHNQISVLESSITPVDREDYDHSGYQYGEDEVVDTDLICEYVFHKDAYKAIQPQQVLDDIAGIEAAQ